MKTQTQTAGETAKHTPGPFWLSTKRRAGKFVILCNTAIPAVYGEVAVVAYKPDAQLFAAAPDLLAALQWAQQFIPAEKGSCRETVRLAIAKATGAQ
jgi:hypothetical protein